MHVRTSHFRVCDRLHCTTCDNKIVTFENFEWNSSCDYLFFRNNYPDFSKLKSKLISHAGKFFILYIHTFRI